MDRRLNIQITVLGMLFSTLFSLSAAAVTEKIDRRLVQDPTKPLGASAISSRPEVRKRPQYSLSSIVYRENRAQAVINGRFYQVGDTVDGARVSKILRDKVVLDDSFGSLTLRLKEVRSLRRD